MKRAAIDRRSFLLSVAAAGVGGERAPQVTAQAPRTTMGVGVFSFGLNPTRNSAYDFLEYCHALGAGGVQAGLASLEPEYLEKVKRRAEEYGMYFEALADLPRDDNTAKFEQLIIAAKRAGAICVRSGCLEGRRYETFSRLDDWNHFVAESHQRLARGAPILDKHRMPLALENHKDWTADELAALMKEYSSEYLGVCVDTGNNISLLDDPMEVVEKLAPYAVSTHFKDMAVEEYPEGFLLSETPLGQGILDLRRMVESITKARPRAKFTLEMITRDPLKIPCLDAKYWATFPGRNGSYLARTLSMVRAHKPAQSLPRASGLESAARQKLEEENVKLCLSYAREQLGMAG
jgi:sugar phosphate isomerase/epimerase